MKQLKNMDLVATLCCLGFLTCWTIGPIQIKFLTGYLDVWTQNFLRYLVACVCWLPVLIMNIRKGNVPRCLLIAALWPTAANLVMQYFWGASFYHADPGFVMLLSKTSVFWVAIFSMAFFADERPLLKTAMFWVGLIGSFVGVAGVIVFKEKFAFDRSLTGAVFGVICSFMWAVYTILVKRTFAKVDPRLSFSIITVYTVIGLAVLDFTLGEPAGCLKMDGRGWMYIVVSAITSIAMAHVFFYTAIQRIGATIPSMFLLAAPFTTAAASIYYFQETLTIPQWISGAVLVVGAAAGIMAQKAIVKKETDQ